MLLRASAVRLRPNTRIDQRCEMDLKRHQDRKVKKHYYRMGPQFVNAKLVNITIITIVYDTD